MPTPATTPKKPTRLPPEVVQALRLKLAADVRQHQYSVDHWGRLGHRLPAAQARSNLELAKAALNRLNLTYQPTADESAAVGEACKPAVKPAKPVVKDAPKANP